MRRKFNFSLQKLCSFFVCLKKVQVFWKLVLFSLSLFFVHLLISKPSISMLAAEIKTCWEKLWHKSFSWLTNDNHFFSLAVNPYPKRNKRRKNIYRAIMCQLMLFYYGDGKKTSTDLDEHSFAQASKTTFCDEKLSYKIFWLKVIKRSPY